MRISGKKIFWVVLIILIGIALIFMFTEVIYPRNEIIQGSLDGSAACKLEKYEKNSNYYVSFNQDNKEVILVCTKEQYDFMTSNKQVYILYKKNFFNRNKGKVMKADDKPIDNSYRGM